MHALCPLVSKPHPLAALMVGRYATGDGVPANLHRAFALFQKAAGMGHARAMCFVAAAYHLGQGVGESRFEALRWCGLPRVCHYSTACDFSAVCRYQRSAALGDTLAKRKISEFGILDGPALLKSRIMHGIKNFSRRNGGAK
jgi:TPR repeat protein